MIQRKRLLPRPFSYHWGSGAITEEAVCEGEYHNPAIQLLEYTEGEAQGSFSIRFCYFSHDGRFQRSPLLIGEDDIAGLREALDETPRLKSLLRRLVAGDDRVASSSEGA